MKPAALLALILAQIYVYDEGSPKGRPVGVNFTGSGVSATCINDGGLNQRCDVAVSGGGGTSPSGLCGDGGTALGFDGGAFYCAAVVKAGSCSAGEYVTAISTTAAPTCSSNTADGGSAESWHNIGDTGEPSFQSSWVNYDTSVYHPAGFRIEDGRVFLRGLIKNGSVAPSCDAYIFTLPGGHRPAKQANMPVVANGLFGFVGVKTDGNVCFASGSNTWVSLEGVSFAL